MSVAIRDAAPSDLDAVMAIEREVFPLDAWPEELMRSELSLAANRYLVALDSAVSESAFSDGAAIVAYAGVRVVGDQGDIQTIAVAPTHRRQGIARALLVELLAEARRRRAADVFLEVRADNPGAVALYQELGFERLAIRPKYYPGAAGSPPVDAIVMRKVRP